MDKFSLKKENYNSLDDLFSEWKERHSEECESSYEKTAPKSKNEKCIPNYNDFKNSFCPDGYLDNSCKTIKVLFVCKESNTDGKKADEIFWLKEVVEARKNDKKYREVEYQTTEEKKKDRAMQTKFFNRLNLVATNLSNSAEKENELVNCAYMNINKRGGYSECNEEQLENYFDKYREYILKEIGFLNPQNIVFLGIPQIIIDRMKDLGIPMFKAYHPSYRCNNEKASELKNIGV